MNIEEATKPEFTKARCLGELRTVPLSGMQAHRKKLQQAWEVRVYRFGIPWKQYTEWRDVPHVVDNQ